MAHHAHMHHGAERVFSGKAPEASADMNVTPLIDVLLVLLIIFMAALPLTQKGVDINLPLEVASQPVKSTPTDQIVIDVTADHRITVNKQDVTLPELEGFLRTTFETRREKTLFIMGAPTVAYGEVMGVIDAASGAGITKVGIVTMGMREEGMRNRAAAPKGK